MTAYSAYLRIRHPSIDPAEITRTLVLQPAHTWAAGSVRASAGEAAPTRAHAETYWLAPLVLGPTDPNRPGKLLGVVVPLEGFLLTQVRRLGSHQAFFGQIVRDGGSCDLCLSLNLKNDFGIELPPTLLRAIADLNLTLSIELADEPEPEQ